MTGMESQGHIVHTWSGRMHRMPINRAQFESLLKYLEELIAMQGCDNTLSHAQTWARAHGVPWASLSRSLRSLGGFCDCEVGLNSVSYGDDDDYY